MFAAPVQASFRLPKPVEMLTAHTSWLEHDINDEIGVPDTKVSIIAMNPISENWTTVVFGFFPDPLDAPIPPFAASILRSSLVELVLQHSNLSLTTSIFGQPSSFEVLEFRGGITVIPVQFSSIWMPPQILFNFTLNNSISQILENIDELKDQLKYGLQLRPYETVYIKVTNMDGSTVSPPVIVQASVMSDVVGHIILPERLKQLAEALTSHPPKNLGLDHAVFGKVKQIRLSSYLQQSLSPEGSPSPSPAPSEENRYAAPPQSQYPAFSPIYAPAPSVDNPSPCFFCYSSPPVSASAPVPTQGGRELPTAPSSISPMPSGVSGGHSPRNSQWPSPRVSPKPCPSAHSDPPAPRGFSLRSDPPRGDLPRSAPKIDPDISPSPSVLYGPSPLDQRIGGGFHSKPASSLISSSSICKCLFPVCLVNVKLSFKSLQLYVWVL
ncbi:hypothetical protein ACLOJK_013798 [Asimina triloba]